MRAGLTARGSGLRLAGTLHVVNLTFCWSLPRLIQRWTTVTAVPSAITDPVTDRS